MPATVQTAELLWFVAALPGLWLWLVNLRTAILTLRASRAARISEIGSLWARFSVTIITLLVYVEIAFVVIGAIAMTAVPSPTASAVRSWVFAAIFISASLGITAAAFLWRRVDSAFVRLAAEGSRT